MDNIWVASGASAIIVSTILQMIKNSSLFPFITRHTGKLNAVVSFGIALLSALGIVYKFDFDPATGLFNLGFHGSTSGLALAFEHWIIQWTAQHAFYKFAIVPSEALGEIRTLISRMSEPPPVSEGDAKAQGRKDFIPGGDHI